MVDHNAQLHLRMSLGTRSTYSSCSNAFSRQEDQKAQLRRGQAPHAQKGWAWDNGTRKFKNRQSYCIKKETVLLRK